MGPRRGWRAGQKAKKKVGTESSQQDIGAEDFGLRRDGTKKGNGFLGPLKRPDGSVSSEISIGINIDGKEQDIPLLVPGLTKQEQDFLLNYDPQSEEFKTKLPDSIVKKAVSHARKRLALGKSVFAD